MKKEDLRKLREPIPLQWRVQSSTQYGATMVPYIDARDLAAMLDNVCGAENWFDDYKMVGNRLICELSIRIEGEWITKRDTGSDTNVEAEKGGVSDAFKRAGVKWGVNRTSYEVGTIKLPAKEFKGKFYPVDEKGLVGKAGSFAKGDNLNELCNKIVFE